MPSILATLWSFFSRLDDIPEHIIVTLVCRILNGARSLFPNSQTSFLLLSSLPGLSRADNETISTTPRPTLGTTSRPTQPNVLFIVADDLGRCTSHGCEFNFQFHLKAGTMCRGTTQTSTAQFWSSWQPLGCCWTSTMSSPPAHQAGSP